MRNLRVVFAMLGATLAMIHGPWGTTPLHADFEEVGAAAGIDNAAAAVGGLLWADLDADGDLDALVNTSAATRYLRNEGGDPPTFTDVTPTLAPGLTEAVVDGETRSVVAADLDNDGVIDVIRLDSQAVQIYIGQGSGGDPPFALGGPSGAPNFVYDDTTADFGVNAEGLGVMDLDGDGFLDVVFQNGSGIRFLSNPGDGTANFTGTTPQPAGVATSNAVGVPPDAGVGPNGDYITVADFDLDGLVDVAARIGFGPDIHRQTALGVFTTIDPDLRADNADKGSILFCDLDSDGDFDYIFTDGDNAATPGINSIYIQGDDGSFTESGESIPGGADGLDCGDVDNDGDPDVLFSGTGEKRVLINQWVENGRTSVDLVSMLLGPATAGNGEGAVLGDYDLDGDLDGMFVQNGEGNLLIRNDTNDDNYLLVRVLADVGSCAAGGPVLRDDVGAVAILTSANGETLGAREVNGGQGHGSQGTARLHWGLSEGPTVAHELEVRFSYADTPTATLSVTPANIPGDYQMLEVSTSDPDGDTIPTEREMNDAGDTPDLDGDGYANWYDADADGDGIADAVESGRRDPCMPAADADDNGTLDYLQSEPVTLPDGGAADTGPSPVIDTGVDTSLADAGTPGFSAHGSGCVQCAVGAKRDEPEPLIGVAAVVFALWLRRRR